MLTIQCLLFLPNFNVIFGSGFRFNFIYMYGLKFKQIKFVARLEHQTEKKHSFIHYEIITLRSYFNLKIAIWTFQKLSLK